MRVYTFSLLVSIILLLSYECSPTTKKQIFTLDGEIITKDNPLNADSNAFKTVLNIIRTDSKSPKGMILLLPDGGYEMTSDNSRNEKTAQFLNSQSYDVGILSSGVTEEPYISNMDLNNAMKAFNLIRTNKRNLGIRGDRTIIMGISSGGYIAARMVKNLGGKEQPDDLILISPENLDETMPGTVISAVMPPIQPYARLLCVFSAADDKESVHRGEEYSKMWTGYDGNAFFHLLKDSADISYASGDPLGGSPELSDLLKTFLREKPEVKTAGQNPAAIPVAGYSPDRHAEKLALVAKEKFDLIMVGNSITNNFDKPEYQLVWNQFFAPRKAINLGYSGYRTENILWNIQNGELEGQSPKVIILEIGTNNVDEKNYPTRHTAGQLAGGIEAIVNMLREKCPDAKIIVLRCFPGSYDGPNPTSHRVILNRASDIVSRLADGKHIFYCDVNHVFLNIDGSINHEMMGDWLHPTPVGAKAWAQAMEPLLSELMGDKSLDTDIPGNTAIVPVAKLEEDSYDWWARHAEVLHIKDSITPEIVLIGNSITHFWGGLPALKNADGKPRNANGPETWKSLFGSYRVLNMGFGWDRTQNVLWRLDHGELDGLNPRVVIINIGTNNTSETVNARMNTAPEIVEGIKAICGRVRSKVPGAKIILMAVFPREQSPDNPRRMLINEINRQLEVFAGEQKIQLINIGPKMLAPDGTLTKEIAGDFCHPTEKGYQIWADAICPLISEP